MTGADWERAKNVFSKALEHAADRREAFLEEACSGDPALLEEVRSLLESDAQRGRFMETPAVEAYAELVDSGVDGLAVGQKAGPYTLLERIGTGGMGSVWKAEHEELPGSPVAVKFVRQGVDTASVLRRFANEHRLLANLQHPNISRLLDGGVTEDGRPFFVMEYIQGTPIDDYCDQNGLTVAERLRLFVRACEPVEYAHHSLIVHRDLKPDNIMVTGEGVPKLLDFGISKIFHPDTGEATVTATDWRPMTPQYASPEQIRGDPITTASDVYSLGIVLYELLSGHRPYEVQTSRRDVAERIISDAEPERPSSAVRKPRTATTADGSPRTISTSEELSAKRGHRPDTLSRRLSGDLDTVVLMALRKDVPRRYQSVRELAEDIERHLEGRPVHARDDTFRYRMAKFVRRNRSRVVAGSVVAAIVLAALVGVVWQSRVAEAEAEFARNEAESLHRVVDFMIELFEEPEPGSGPGREQTAADLLQAGVARIQSELQEQPAVRTALLGAMGSGFTRLGELDRAEPLLLEALEVRLGLYTPDHPEIAESLHRLGVLRLRQGRAREAEPLLRQAYGIWRTRWGDYHLDPSQAAFDLGLALIELDRAAEAVDLFEEVLAVQSRLLPSRHPRVRAVEDQLEKARGAGPEGG